MPDTPFTFDDLLEAWTPTPADLAALRDFLTGRAASVIDTLPDSQLPMALAAWQREGELLFAQRQFQLALGHYAALEELLAPLEPLLGLWCAGAVAECRIALGEVAAGLADLAEVLEALEARDHAPGIEAVGLTIAELAEFLP